MASVNTAPTLGRSQPQEIHGHSNHLIEEESKEVPDVVIGEFLVDNTPALVLFDSGATGPFVLTNFVDMQCLPAELRARPIVTSSLLRDLRCTLLWKGVCKHVGGDEFE